MVRDTKKCIEDIKQVYSLAFDISDLSKIEPMPVDMSPRRYFRLTHKGAPLVAMLFDSVAVPEAVGSSEKIDSFDSVVRLSDYLAERLVSVPRLYSKSKELGIIIEDDFGDTFLAEKAGSSTLAVPLYKKAVDEIVRLQSGNHDQSFFALNRGFNEEIFYREMQETPDFYIENLNANPALKERIMTLLKQLSQEVAQFKQTLSLRDFHSWNILIKNSGELGVIDFQDALLAPKTYDLVSLINDRDTDSLLGRDAYDKILNYFFEVHPEGNQLKLEYPLVLLQRDLKVAGRLSKMVKVRGLPQYKKWIPGTVKRISRTLATTSQPYLADLNEALKQADPAGFGA